MSCTASRDGGSDNVVVVEEVVVAVVVVGSPTMVVVFVVFSVGVSLLLLLLLWRFPNDKSAIAFCWAFIVCSVTEQRRGYRRRPGVGDNERVSMVRCRSDKGGDGKRKRLWLIGCRQRQRERELFSHKQKA